MNQRVALRGGAVLTLIVGFLPGLLFLVAGFVGGVYIDQRFPEYVPYIGHRTESRVDLTQVQQAARLIQADYVDSSVDPKKLSQGSVQGLITSLGDPYSIYFDPAQYKKLQQSYQGKYTGIGIYLSFSTGYPVITGTVAGSPAAAAASSRCSQPMWLCPSRRASAWAWTTTWRAVSVKRSNIIASRSGGRTCGARSSW